MALSVASVPKRIAVIGAGIIGLSSALYLNTELRLDGIPCSIEVFAEHRPPLTTSDGAAGLWEPLFVHGTPADQQRWWGRETYQWLRYLRVQKDAGEMGVAEYSGYLLFYEPVEDPPWRDVVIGFRHATDDELKDIQTPVRHGWYFVNMSCQGNRYCSWLLKRCKEQGIIFHEQKINSLSELAGRCDVVVNCSGIGAHKLVGDNDIVPIKGQIMKVAAPWIKQFTLIASADFVSYILPCTDFVVLGGTAESGRWDTDIEPEVSRKILENCSKINGSVENAPVIGEWSGSRPHRKTGVRVERALVPLDSSQRPLEVVHNYGHGGSGITFHWGCARYAASLTRKALGLPDSCGHDDDLLYKTMSVPLVSSSSKL